jgi:amidase
MTRESDLRPTIGLFRLSLIAIFVGVLTGFGAIAFRGLIGFIHNLLFLGHFSFFYDANTYTPPSPWGIFVILVPVVGGLLVTLLATKFAPEARGHGVPEVMDAVYYAEGRIRPIVATVKSLASAVAIGSGVAVGPTPQPMANLKIAQFALIGLSLAGCLSGCATLARRPVTGSRDRAFIHYWPPDNSKRLSLAVKDNIDMKGVVTTAGSQYLADTSPPAQRDAQCLAISRQRNVQIVGKTNLSEFAVAPSGLNEYFGTPRNPFSKLSRRIIPGGSSSGSAVAVARGEAEVAFGTDTAGSIRVPAACCGIVGLKTTFGLVSLKGVFPIEPNHLDTVGPMAKDIAHVVQGMDLLQTGFAARYRAAVAAKSSAKSIRIGRLYLDGTDPKIDKAIDAALAQAEFQVIPLDEAFRTKWDQAKKDGDTVAAAGAWTSDRKYFGKPGVSAKTEEIIALGEFEYTVNYRNALKRQANWQYALRQVFKKVDFIALPTLQKLPPTIPSLGSTALFEAYVLGLQNTAAVNFAGNPALAIPIPVNDKTVPVTSLQLIGPRLSEAELLNAGRLIEASLEKSVLAKSGRKE